MICSKTHNILLRLEAIINCKPDIVTILIGSNDAIRELGMHHSKQSDKMLQLPQEATKKWFTENLEKIITTIKKQTKAKIAVCSLPPLGEILSSKPIDQIRSYSEIIKEIASKNNVIYLPVFEKMIEEIEKSS
ncbi:MAG: SGNH/GDSL hydrolase family protein, partial [Candidatus Heimdallarchaeota archaeon]